METIPKYDSRPTYLDQAGLGYRSIFNLGEHADGEALAREEILRWVEDKATKKHVTLPEIDWASAGPHELWDSMSLFVVSEKSQALERHLVRCVEKTDTGVWTTSVFVLADGASHRWRPTMWIETSGVNHDGQPQTSYPPNFVGDLLERAEARRSGLRISQRPDILRGAEVDDLVEAILDQHRDIPVCVAGPMDGTAPEQWVGYLQKLLRFCGGCVSSAVLDHRAMERLNDALGDAYAVRPGSLRTYLPGVDPEDRSDAVRHRYVTPRTLADNTYIKRGPTPKEWVCKMVGLAPRRYSWERRLPPELARTERVLNNRIRAVERDVRGEVASSHGRPLSAVINPEGANSKPDSPLGSADKRLDTSRDLLNALLSGIMGDGYGEEIRSNPGAAVTLALELHRDLIRGLTKSEAQIEGFEKSEAVLNERIEALETSNLERMLEASDANEDYRILEKKVRRLEYQLANARHEDSPAPQVTDFSECASLANMVDLYERMTEDSNYDEIRKFVELSNKDQILDEALALDDDGDAGRYAKNFWDGILTLMDYVLAKKRGDVRNMYDYLRSDVPGFKCPASWLRSNESQTVKNNPALRSERVFPVPRDVNSSGRVLMTEHLAPTHRDQRAPRLYYYDDCDGTGKVYIGYIGRHLRNASTN